MKTISQSSGQVALITLLVLTIATTVALSLISRTTTDVSITNQVEESSRAFSAAEAGIEEALKTGQGTIVPATIAGAAGVTYNVLVKVIGGTAAPYEFPNKIQKNITETVWLVKHDVNGVPIEDPNDPGRYKEPSIDICWSKETPEAALIVTLLYKESSVVVDNYRVVKAAFDPSPSSRLAPNQFTSVSANGGCGANTDTAYRETLTFASLNPTIDYNSDTLIALRVRPEYNDAKIMIAPIGGAIPSQGNRIESTGSTTTGTNRKIVVYQQYRSPSTVFDAALYSEGSISYQQ